MSALSTGTLRRKKKKSQAAYYAQVAGAIAAQKKNVCNRVAVCIIVKQPCEDLRVFIAVHCILDDVGGVLKIKCMIYPWRASKLQRKDNLLRILHKFARKCQPLRVVEWVALIRFLFGMQQHYQSTLDFAFLF